MKKGEYITVAELAKILGITRAAVYKKIKKGQIKPKVIGGHILIPPKYYDYIVGKKLSDQDKKLIDRAVKKTFKEYGEVLIELGKE